MKYQIVPLSLIGLLAVLFIVAYAQQGKTDYRQDSKLSSVTSITSGNAIELSQKDGILKSLVDRVAAIEKQLQAQFKKPKHPPASITMLTRSSCPPCASWKRNESPKVIKAGWEFREQVSNGTTPTFIIECNGKRVQHVGYLTMKQLAEYVETKLK